MNLGSGDGLRAMIIYATSISLDGFTAGPDQSTENPLGVGGMQLHEWIRELAVWRKAHGMEGGVERELGRARVASRTSAPYVMGRNMFGGGPGPWGDDPWNGWWGDDPPFHLPVFVVTHHARPPLECEGGTTFTFVTEGAEAAVALALEAAAGRDVMISGGSTVARQCLEAGLVDELRLDLVPVFLGSGVRLFDSVSASLGLEQLSVVEGPRVTHLAYRVSSGSA